MTIGTTKDRQLLEVLEEVITRNKAEYEIDDGNNEEFINACGDYDEADHHSHLYKNPILLSFLFLLNIKKLILARL